MKLKKLNLSIPSMDSDECKSLMGGDGYIMLDEVVVIGHSERPDQDVDRDNYDDNQDDDTYPIDYQDEGDRDENNDSSDNKQSDNLATLLEIIPRSIQDYLTQNNITIKLDPNVEKANYDPNTYTITLKSTTDYITFIHESVHAIQHRLGHMDGESQSAEEFQAHALTDLYTAYLDIRVGYGFTSVTIRGGDYDEWLSFLNDCLNEDDGSLDRDYFKAHVMDFFDDFQATHSDSKNGYTDPLEDGYEWDWDLFFEMLGL